MGRKEKIVTGIAAVVAFLSIASKGWGIKVVAVGVVAHYAYRYWKNR